MKDDALLTAVSNHFREVRSSIAGVRMDTTAGDILTRAKRRRSRRVLAGAGAACAAMGLAAVLAVPGGPTVQARAVHVHLGAWSVDSNPDGTVTFKLRDTSQPARLERVLAQAGVPAMVRSGEICLARGRRVLLPTEGIVSYVNGRPTRMSSVFLLYGSEGPNKPLNWSWTVSPSKIPGGAHFVISAIRGHHVPASQVQAVWEFVPESAHVDCAPSVTP